MQEPVVSICCLVYNHEPFLRECFEGFVMQKTTFPIEILVHDDASTDHSADIIREYTAKYPDLFKPIYQTENQYSKGVKVSATFQFPRAKGKYIALCEGDDYWTDPYKLQKQVDFLESHPEYVMCSHNHKIFYQEEHKYHLAKKKELPQVYDLDYLIHGGWNFHPLTVLFKRQVLDIQQYQKFPNTMDAVLFYVILKEGPGYCFDEEMAVYRLHNGGVWSKIGQDRQRMMEYKARLGIYSVEKTKEAATFLLTQLTKLTSRKWMISNIVMFTKVFLIIRKHFGTRFVVKLIWNKTVCGKNFRWSV